MDTSSRQDSAELAARFEAILAEYGPALRRVASGYEADEDKKRDLAQEMAVAIWRAMPGFEGRASLRTWVFRIAHNVAVTHVVRNSRDRLSRCVPLEQLEEEPGILPEMEQREGVRRLAELVRALRPADRQVVLLYLEGLEHAEIADVTGLSRENVAVKIHRLKNALRAALARGELR